MAAPKLAASISIIRIPIQGPMVFRSRVLKESGSGWIKANGSICSVDITFLCKVVELFIVCALEWLLLCVWLLFPLRALCRLPMLSAVDLALGTL